MKIIILFGRKNSRLLFILVSILVVIFFLKNKIDYHSFVAKYPLVSIFFKNAKQLLKQSDKFESHIFEDETQNELYSKYRSSRISGPSRLKRSGAIPSPKDFYIINEYTPFYGQSKYCHQKKDQKFLNKCREKNKDGNQILEKIFQAAHSTTESFEMLDNCVYKNCFFTCESQLAPQSDALMFLHSDLVSKAKALNLGNDFSKIYPAMFPFQRRRNQIWMLWNDEPGPYDPILNGFEFNWTLTFQSMSEVSYCTYGCIINRYELTIKNFLWFAYLINIYF